MFATVYIITIMGLSWAWFYLDLQLPMAWF